VRNVNKYIYLFLISILLLSTFLSNTSESANSNVVVVLKINTPITRGVDELVYEAIKYCESMNAPLIIILNTPGGLFDTARNIVEYIVNSRIPVIGYVHPSGAQAWSAGTLILLSTHVAAMTPGTLIGVAQPAIYDPSTGRYRPVNESKIVNPIIALMKNLAERRGRNVSAAEKFVLENLYLDDEKAHQYHVIEVVASNIRDLLDKINGWSIKLDNGVEYILNTVNAEIIEYSGSLRTRIIIFLSDPLINSLLTTISVLMLVFSILSGHYNVLPLAIGLLLLSLIGSNISVNNISIVLLIIGAIALAIELVTPGFGILGFTGILLIAISVALLPVFNPGYLFSPEYQTMLFWFGTGLAIVFGSIASFIIYKVLKIKREPLKIKTDIKGFIGRAIDDISKGNIGFIFVNGEYWRALALEDIKSGDKVIVVDKNGSILKVKKYTED